MITEDYCSYEIAKLLKEKGFDAECRAAYTNYGKLFTTQIQQYITNVLCSRGTLWDCTAPTHQMAMRWLRDVHKLSIEPFYMFPAIWEIDIKYIDKKTDLSEFEDIRDKSYNSYEEAAEAGIKYCLENLI